MASKGVKMEKLGILKLAGFVPPKCDRARPFVLSKKTPGNLCMGLVRRRCRAISRTTQTGVSFEKFF